MGQFVEVVGQHPATHELPYVVNKHVLSTAQAKVESFESKISKTFSCLAPGFESHIPRSCDIYPQTLPGTESALSSCTLALLNSGGLVGCGLAVTGCNCMLRSPVCWAGTYPPWSRAWFEFHLKPPASIDGREQPMAAKRRRCFMSSLDEREEQKKKNTTKDGARPCSKLCDCQRQ